MHQAAAEFRLPVPLAVVDVRQDNYRTKTLVLDGALTANPGQFVMVWLPRFDEKPFSLVAADPVTLMVTAVGPMSRLLHSLERGDTLWVRGPFGQGFTVPSGEERLAFVGGGYGVAPLLWLARTQVAHVQSIAVVIGARTAQDLLYVADFTELADSSQRCALRVATTTEDGTAGLHGKVTDWLAPKLAAGQWDGLYGCGPHGMLSALREFGQQYGIACQLSWEAYMRCAMGICGACEHEGRVLCMDGPVLRYPGA